MSTNSGAASTPPQRVHRYASPFPTNMGQVAFVGRVINNAGGSSQRKFKSPWFSGVGSCSQRKPAPNTAGADEAVRKSDELKDLLILRSPATMAGTVHEIDPSSVPVSVGGPTASVVKHGHTSAVAAGTGNANGWTCHVTRCKQAAFGHMDGYPTIPLCENHLEDNSRRLRSNADQIEGKSNPFFGRNACEYPECTKKPRYSPTKGGPVRACKHHKKAGMFSTRNGQILYAIHDGDALRYRLSSSTNSPPKGDEGERRPSSAEGQKSRHSTPVDAMQFKSRRSKSQPSRPAGTFGEKSEAKAATRSEVDTDSSASRSDRNAPTQRSSKLSDVTGIVPSVEMKALQKEREDVVADASAIGRRLRVPSRKVLEASGKLKNDGVQWMSKEMYKADVQLRKEVKEQRKAEADAKMKAGHKLDKLEVRIKVEDSVDVGRAEKSASGGSTGREDVGIRGWESQSSTPTRPQRRTWWAVKLPQAGARRRVSYTSESKRKVTGGASAEGGSRKRSSTGTGTEAVQQS